MQNCRARPHTGGLEANGDRCAVEHVAHEPIGCVAHQAGVQQAVTCSCLTVGGRDPQGSGVILQQLPCFDVSAVQDMRRDFLSEDATAYQTANVEIESWHAVWHEHCPPDAPRRPTPLSATRGLMPIAFINYILERAARFGVGCHLNAIRRRVGRVLLKPIRYDGLHDRRPGSSVVRDSPRLPHNSAR